MAQKKQNGVTKSPASPTPVEVTIVPKCRRILENGISTAKDFTDAMSAAMADVVSDRITTKQANAVGYLGGRLLKGVEVNHRLRGKNGSGVKLLS